MKLEYQYSSCNTASMDPIMLRINCTGISLNKKVDKLSTKMSGRAVQNVDSQLPFAPVSWVWTACIRHTKVVDSTNQPPNTKYHLS